LGGEFKTNNFGFGEVSAVISDLPIIQGFFVKDGYLVGFDRKSNSVIIS